jgi:hypothetical protein
MNVRIVFFCVIIFASCTANNLSDKNEPCENFDLSFFVNKFDSLYLSISKSDGINNKEKLSGNFNFMTFSLEGLDSGCATFEIQRSPQKNIFYFEPVEDAKKLYPFKIIISNVNNLYKIGYVIAGPYKGESRLCNGFFVFKDNYNPVFIGCRDYYLNTDASSINLRKIISVVYLDENLKGLRIARFNERKAIGYSYYEYYRTTDRKYALKNEFLSIDTTKNIFNISNLQSYCDIITLDTLIQASIKSGNYDKVIPDFPNLSLPVWLFNNGIYPYYSKELGTSPIGYWEDE